MTSNTCVAPPVGSGKAGRPSRRMKISAKLFSWKTSIRPPSLLSPSLASQLSSWSLTFSGAGRGPFVGSALSGTHQSSLLRPRGARGRRPCDDRRRRRRGSAAPAPDPIGALALDQLELDLDREPVLERQTLARRHLRPTGAARVLPRCEESEWSEPRRSRRFGRSPWAPSAI